MAEQIKLERLNIPRSNTYLVGVTAGKDDRILIMRAHPLHQTISREYALNLAAWLVALAAPSDEDRALFHELLKEVDES